MKCLNCKIRTAEWDSEPPYQDYFSFCSRCSTDMRRNTHMHYRTNHFGEPYPTAQILQCVVDPATDEITGYQCPDHACGHEEAV